MAERKVYTTQRAMGVALLLLAILSGITSYIQAEKTNQIATCVASYQAGFSKALKVRTDSQGQFNDALNHLMITVAHSKSPEEVSVALNEYITTANHRDADLRENPYPDPSVCN